MRILLAILLIATIHGRDFTIKQGEVTYYGYHLLHDWKGTSKHIGGNFTFESSLENFDGIISIPVKSFDSGNSNRDSNMLVYCKGIQYPDISFRPKEIIKDDNLVTIKGLLIFAGNVQNLTTSASVKAISDNSCSAEGKFDIFLSKFDIERPSLLFTKIEDRISIEYVIIGEEKDE